MDRLLEGEHRGKKYVIAVGDVISFAALIVARQAATSTHLFCLGRDIAFAVATKPAPGDVAASALGAEMRRVNGECLESAGIFL